MFRLWALVVKAFRSIYDRLFGGESTSAQPIRCFGTRRREQWLSFFRWVVRREHARRPGLSGQPSRCRKTAIELTELGRGVLARAQKKEYMYSLKLLAFLVMAPLFVGCGDDGASGSGQGGAAGTGGGDAGGGDAGGGGMASAPTVISNIPDDGAIGVATNGAARVAFSLSMDCATLTTGTFLLMETSGATPVAGSVLCADSKAAFWPSAQLASDSLFTATVTTGALSEAGVALEADYIWSFTTGALADTDVPVDLGTAADYAILAKAAISTVPTALITGHIGVSPAAATYLTGFSLSVDASGEFATSPQVTGRVFAADYAAPTPTKLTTAVLDMQLAFSEAAARAPDTTELGAGNIGGMTLPAGVYKWGTSLLLPSDVTLDGSATDVWIFQIAGDLLLSSAVQVSLSGGAQARNIFWQVAGLVDVGTTAQLEGVVLTETAVTVQTGASVHGRLLAQTAVSLDGNAITEP